MLICFRTTEEGLQSAGLKVIAKGVRSGAFFCCCGSVRRSQQGMEWTRRISLFLLIKVWKPRSGHSQRFVAVIVHSMFSFCTNLYTLGDEQYIGDQ